MLVLVQEKRNKILMCANLITHLLQMKMKTRLENVAVFQSMISEIAHTDCSKVLRSRQHCVFVSEIESQSVGSHYYNSS